MCVFRYKQIAAERLAIAGLHVAYGFTDFPTNGPFPINIALAQPGKVCTVLQYVQGVSNKSIVVARALIWTNIIKDFFGLFWWHFFRKN